MTKRSQLKLNNRWIALSIDRKKVLAVSETIDGLKDKTKSFDSDKFIVSFALRSFLDL